MGPLLAAINLGEILWTMLVVFIMVMYFMVLFTILGDLFRDHDMGGVAKAVWVICLILFTWLAALIYLIVRGGGMAQRAAKAQAEAQKHFVEYAKTVAEANGGTAAAEIERAKGLLDAGVISQEEFDSIKSKALA